MRMRNSTRFLSPFGVVTLLLAGCGREVPLTRPGSARPSPALTVERRCCRRPNMFATASSIDLLVIEAELANQSARGRQAAPLRNAC